MIKIFVPRDTTACALGADLVASAIQTQAENRGLAIQIVRNGSRGAFWLEPLIEVEINGERIAYGPVLPEQIDELFEAGFPECPAHSLCLGPVEQIDYL